MSKVTYEYLFGDEPLFPTYMQLQMVDQSIRFFEGIAKYVMVRIYDQFAPADFMVLDMGEEEDDTPIILGRLFLNTTNAIIYIESGQVHFEFPREKVRYYFNSYTLMSSRRSPAPGGDVDHPKTKRINPKEKLGGRRGTCRSCKR